jgi:hypothetical protein
MNSFEHLIGKTFQSYRDARLATMIFLHPPMRVAGMMGRVPCFIQAGKAPFDLGGMYYDVAGTVIAAELKETAEHATSLPIIGPGKKGSGLQYHQLDALTDVHLGGGVALVLYSNGGEIGLLRGGRHPPGEGAVRRQPQGRACRQVAGQGEPLDPLGPLPAREVRAR